MRQPSPSGSAGDFPSGPRNATFCNRRVTWVLLFWECIKNQPIHRLEEKSECLHAHANPHFNDDSDKEVGYDNKEGLLCSLLKEKTFKKIFNS